VAWGFAFVTPALALFAVMGVYTLGWGLELSFFRWNGLSPTWLFVGLRNYTDLLYASAVYAPIVRRAALNTLAVMVAAPALIVVVSFPLAVLLNRARRFAGVLRSIYFVPYVTTGVAVYLAWQYVLEPNGAVNLLLRTLGLGSLAQPQGWLGNPSTALPTLVVIMVWSGVPVATLLYLSGLQSIDPALVEAAQLDGASWWRVNRSVVWPLVRGITLVVLLLNLRDALQGFQIFLLMTNGGPADHTSVLGLQTYKLAFTAGFAPTLGLASALGWMLFAAAIVVAVVNHRVTRRVA
jgi:multiple sugar transport system permease protein